MRLMPPLAIKVTVGEALSDLVRKGLDAPVGTRIDPETGWLMFDVSGMRPFRVGGSSTRSRSEDDLEYAEIDEEAVQVLPLLDVNVLLAMTWPWRTSTAFPPCDGFRPAPPRRMGNLSDDRGRVCPTFGSTRDRGSTHRNASCDARTGPPLQRSLSRILAAARLCHRPPPRNPQSPDWPPATYRRDSARSGDPTRWAIGHFGSPGYPLTAAGLAASLEHRGHFPIMDTWKENP